MTQKKKETRKDKHERMAALARKKHEVDEQNKKIEEDMIDALFDRLMQDIRDFDFPCIQKLMSSSFSLLNML